MTFQSDSNPTKDKIGEKYMKNTKEKLQHLKELMTIVNDENIKQTLKDKAWLELWANLEPSVGKVVNKTISKYYKKDRPSNDVVNDAIFDSILFIVKDLKSWDPSKSAPATYAYNKIAELTMKVVGVENLTLDIDETTEEGALKKQDLEMRLLEKSAWGRTSGTTNAGDVVVEHPFDMLANLDNPLVSLLLEALNYLIDQNFINSDGATICAERVTGTEYSIIAEYLGKTEAATRKISERVNAELKKLNLEMPRYVDLIKIPMIAAVVEGKASKKSK